MRFHNGVAERAFVAKRLASTRCLIISAGFWLFVLAIVRSPDVSSPDYAPFVTVIRGVMILAAVSLMVVPFVATHKWPVFTDVFVTGMFVVIIVGQSILWNLIDVPDVSSDSRWRPGQSIHQPTLHMIQCLRIVLGCHLVLNLRWSSLAVVAFVAVCSFVVNFMLGDSILSVDHLLFLTPILVFVSWGARNHEIQARMLFLILFDERTERMETEHELSMKNDPMQKVPDDTFSQHMSVKSHGCASSASSRPETTETGKLFAIAGDPGTTMDRLMDIGQQENWLIKEQELSLKPRILGQGGFGIVFSGEFCGMPVAVKMPRKQGAKMGSLLTELRALRKVRHPNIVSFHGCCFLDENSSILLVSEFCGGQRMTGVVNGDVIGAINDLHRCEMLNGLMNAFHYLHTRSPMIVHGDLKPGNCLVDVKARYGFYESPDCKWALQVKLLDFGLSRFCTSNAVGGGGTLRWIAPELILNGTMRPSSSTDVFSMGRLMYYLVTGLLPFHNYSHEDIAVNSVDAKVDWPHESRMEVALYEYADLCMDTNPDKRPAIPETHSQITTLLHGVMKVFLGAPAVSPNENAWKGIPLQALVADIQHSVIAGASKKDSLPSDTMALVEMPGEAPAACSLKQSSEPHRSHEQVPTDFVEIEVHPCDPIQDPLADPMQDPQAGNKSVLRTTVRQDANHPAPDSALHNL